MSCEASFISDEGEDFNRAIQKMYSCGSVGFDGEYRMGLLANRQANLPTYIQLSTSDEAFVFNVKEMEAKPTALKELAILLASDKVKKVGHSVLEDLKRIFDYFKIKLQISPPVAINMCSLDIELFTIKPPSTLGLSDLSNRYLGKTMKKRDKDVRAGNKNELTNSKELEYVALDALAPLHIYNKFAEVLSSSFSGRPIIGNRAFRVKFFVDQGLQILVQPMKKKKLDTIFLSNVTHEQIVALCTQFSDRILITHDKWLLLNDRIKNKIPYLSPEQVISEVTKLSVCAEKGQEYVSDSDSSEEEI